MNRTRNDERKSSMKTTLNHLALTTRALAVCRQQHRRQLDNTRNKESDNTFPVEL